MEKVKKYVKEERNKYIQSYEAKWIFWEFGGREGEDCDVGDEWERKKRISVIYIVDVRELE